MKKIIDIITGRDKLREELESFHDEIKNLEGTLKDREESYKLLVQTLPDIIYQVDVEGRFTFLNEAVALLGYKPSELIGKDFSLIIHPDDFPRVSRVQVLPKYKGKITGDKGAPKLFDERRTLHRQTRNLEIRLRPKPGAKIKTFVGEIDATGIFAQMSAYGRYKNGEVRMGNFLGSAGIIRDITERKRAEKKLKTAQGYAQSLIDNSLDMIISVDSDRRIVEFNLAAQKTFGYSKAEVLSKHVNLLYANSAEGLKIHQTAQRTGQFTGEIVNKRKSGETFPALLTASAIQDANGKFWGLMGVSRDITELKEAQGEAQKAAASEAAAKEAKAGREKIENIFESMVDGVIVNDVDGNIIQTNQAFTKMVGYRSAKKLIGESFFKFIAERELPRVQKEFRKIVKKNKEYVRRDWEITGQRKNGLEFPLRLNLRTILDKGKCVASVAVVRDITKQKKMEKALRESEEQYRAIFEQAADSIVLINAETGALVEFNDQAHESLGYTREEFQKLQIPDFEIIESAEQVTKHMEKIIKKGADIFETKHRTKDGKMKDILVSCRAISIRDRTFIQGIWRDITAQKQAEKILREKEEFNRALFEYNPIDTIVVDRQARITMFNLAQKDSGDRLPNIGEVLYKDYAGKHQTDMYSEMMKCIRTGEAKEFPELKYGNKFLSIIISPFPKGAIITSHDVTGHWKAAEKEKQRRIELEKAYAEQRGKKEGLIRSEKLAFTGRIAASIAHEIRNPLTNVSMSTQQFKRHIKPNHPMAKHVDIITRNTERINFLITELLNCARPPKLDMRPYDVHNILEDVLDSTKTKIEAKKIKLVERFTPELSIINLDKEQMGRVFSNLVINAIEAMPKRGGQLTLTTKYEGDFLVMKIQDTGKGISEEDIMKIFDPFFSSKSSGVGLGLTICYGIIVSHGGTIEVQSKSREGSIFTVSLPVEGQLPLYLQKKKS